MWMQKEIYDGSLHAHAARTGLLFYSYNELHFVRGLCSIG